MTLRWTEIAVQHLAAAHAYVAEDNPTEADNLLDRLLSAAEILAKHPHAGRAGRVPKTRELVVAGTPTLIVYHLDPEEVTILAVFHGSRKWPEAF